MKKITLLFALLCSFTLFAQLDANDVVYYLGEGENTAYVLVDFRDDTPDSSFGWGIRYDDTDSISMADALLMIEAADTANFTVNAQDYGSMGLFLNDIIYNHHQGLAGQPDYWSIWDGYAPDSLEMTSVGMSSIPLESGKWYGFSYGFSPAKAPSFTYAAYNPDWFDFSEVTAWFGEGTNQMVFTIDFVTDDSLDTVTYAWGLKFSDDLNAKEALLRLADYDPNLSVAINNAGVLTTVTYKSLTRSADTTNQWHAFIGTTMANYRPAQNGLSSTIVDGDLFGISFGGQYVRRPYIPTVVDYEDMGNEEFSPVEVRIWPNPVARTLHINTPTPIQHIQVFTMQGRKVIETTEASLPVQNLSSGMYIIRVKSQQGYSTQQFIKQ